jgi:hypothetical protein
MATGWLLRPYSFASQSFGCFAYYGIIEYIIAHCVDNVKSFFVFSCDFSYNILSLDAKSYTSTPKFGAQNGGFALKQ